MFAGVAGVRYAEAELKVKSLQERVSEEVPFDHSKVTNGTTAHGEFDPETLKQRR